jgi:hypothetical protein
MKPIVSLTIAAAALLLTAAAPVEDRAELAGCHAGAASAWVRAQVAAGTPPLLVLDGEPAGPLRYAAARCERLPWRDLVVLEIRLIRPDGARNVYGAAAANGAVIVEFAAPPPSRRPR